MYQLGNDPLKMKMAAVLLFTGVGTPYIYYGEEIGMTQNQIGDEQFQRAPMQWDDGKYAGFTTGNSLWIDDRQWFSWRKEHKPWWKPMWDSFEDKKGRSVAGQKNDPDSLLNLYKQLIKIRKENPEFRSIDPNYLEFIETKTNVLIFKRVGSRGEESMVILNGSETVASSVKIDDLQGKKVVNLLNGNELMFEDGRVTINAGGFYILKFQSDLSNP